MSEGQTVRKHKFILSITIKKQRMFLQTDHVECVARIERK